MNLKTLLAVAALLMATSAHADPTHTRGSVHRTRNANVPLSGAGADLSPPLRREILVSGTAQKKYFYAKARRNWQARAAYSAGATNPPSPLTGRF
jgi:hypothetical protein